MEGAACSRSNGEELEEVDVFGVASTFAGFSPAPPELENPLGCPLSGCGAAKPNAATGVVGCASLLPGKPEGSRNSPKDSCDVVCGSPSLRFEETEDDEDSSQEREDSEDSSGLEYAVFCVPKPKSPCPVVSLGWEAIEGCSSDTAGMGLDKELLLSEG